MPTIISGLSESNFNASAKLPGNEEYIWVESTVCKGMRLSHDEDFDYDLKMVTRNIEDRKRQAQTQLENIMRASEEQARINAAKLRYISCIAHDLKTPLQSFCFSLDLLQQTPMHAEQRECVAQANVAVDLMKLTISQTMDISKALSGAKLTPRCTTVSLPSVLDRVKVIM
jgi:signal transduction histidine kinase